MKVKTFRFLLTATPEYIDEKINEFLTGGKEPVMLADCKIARTENFLIYTLIMHDPKFINQAPVELNIVGESGEQENAQEIIQG